MREIISFNLSLIAGIIVTCSAWSNSASADSEIGFLPLQSGYYVEVSQACAKASVASLTLVTRKGVSMVAHINTKYKRVEKIGQTTYRVVEDNIDLNTNKAFSTTVVYEVTNPTSYRVTTQYGTTSARLCPQSSLPDLWRTSKIQE